MATATGPTTQQSSFSGGRGVLPWSALMGVDEAEYVPELMFPQSVKTYDRMSTDAQVSSLYRSVGLPLQARDYQVDPNGAERESVERLADDLGLPIVGEEQLVRRRSRNRFSWNKHLIDLLRALQYGFYFFEQLGTIDEEAEHWSLRKLAPIPPRTIGEMRVEDDGGLKWIKQLYNAAPPEISIDRLLCYVWDQEAGNWTGRSMLRPLYKNWVIKDRLLRVDAIKHERTGMGIPVAEAPPGATSEQIAEMGEMMRAMKITEGGGGAVPSGAKPQLMGTTGSVPDTVASMRFQNEEMAAAFLAMFKQLGQTQTGSRALGETMIDFFGLGLDAIETWFLDTFNEHMVEDWYDINYTEESQPARVVRVDEPDPEEEFNTFAEGVADGAEEREAEIEEAVARLRGKKTPKRRRTRRTKAAAMESPSLPLPDRKLRRLPYEHEVRAQTDFAAIDADLSTGVDKLITELNKVQKPQIDELHDLIVDAKGDLKKLATLSPQPVAEDALIKQMRISAKSGIDTALAEASAQGVSSPKKATVPDIEPLLRNRAVATSELLARSIGEAAGRHAIRLTGEGAQAAEVAAQVKSHLLSLSDAYLKEQANGVLTSAMNTGRRTVMNRNEPVHVYASELLDESTCEECVAVDGTEYDTVAEAESDYPTGGYGECLGRERCRGTVVATYEEVAA